MRSRLTRFSIRSAGEQSVRTRVLPLAHGEGDIQRTTLKVTSLWSSQREPTPSLGSRVRSKFPPSQREPATLAKLSDDAHFPGSILANANWLIPIFEFPPAPVPINHGHKTGEGGGNGFGVAVLHPDTEPRLMFSFIDAGGWFAHLFTPLTLSALNSLAGIARGGSSRKARSSHDTYLTP
jgi:hypothetical protein